MNTNEIAAAIRAGIANGRYPYGSRLPAVRDLASEYGVSQQTAAAAYATLGVLGLTRTKPGSGTTVTAGRSADAHLGDFAPPDLSTALPWRPSGDGAASEETTLVRQITASALMAEWGITEGAALVERTRVRSIDGVPVQHKLTLIPLDYASRRPEGYEGVPPMLAPVGADATATKPRDVRMADWLGWDVSHSECAITAEPMTPDAAAALGVTEGSPGFRVVAVTRASDGDIVSVTVTTAPLHHRVTLNILG